MLQNKPKQLPTLKMKPGRRCFTKSFTLFSNMFNCSKSKKSWIRRAVKYSMSSIKSRIVFNRGKLTGFFASLTLSFNRRKFRHFLKIGRTSSVEGWYIQCKLTARMLLVGRNTPSRSSTFVLLMIPTLRDSSWRQCRKI
jgi:hypothetical protein